MEPLELTENDFRQQAMKELTDQRRSIYHIPTTCGFKMTEREIKRKAKRLAAQSAKKSKKKILRRD